ncbi:MAG: hypothetical protein JNM56_24290 [Planctomycetia bacterium]|nr:hypothetical protein [Planctomycetia bacterium]
MKIAHGLCLALAPLFLAGCQGMSHTDKGVLGGAALGSGVGAIIGSATKNTGAGAVVGGLAGGLAGGVIGNSIDESEKRQEIRLAAAQAAAQPQTPPLGLTDIVQMAQQRISDAIIIQQIRTTNSVYHLSPADLQWLNANGVSDAVVMEMQATANRPPKRVYVPAPRERVVIVEPPPPVGIGIGFGYHPRRRGW